MRVALISDIHGNGVALDVALEDLGHRGYDALVCLGDALQGGSEPARVAERLRDLGCPVVLGNSDSFLLDGVAAEDVSPATREVGEWTRARLGAEGLDLIRGYVPTVEIDLGGARSLLCFHGSPTSFDDVILPETPRDELDGLLGDRTGIVYAGGHTHVQWTRWNDERPYLNPGSVGVPYNRHRSEESFFLYPVAEYAILHVEDAGIGVEFCHVPFDVDALDKAARASGKPYGDREGAGYRPRV